jgi:uncharacterized protein YqfA (UPF0365 family)
MIAVWVLAVIVGIALLSAVLTPYVRSQRHDATISLGNVVGMKLRNVDPVMIAQARGMLLNAGFDVSVNQMETQQLAGGKPLAIANAMVAAGAA